MYYPRTRYVPDSISGENKAWDKIISHVQPGSKVLEFGCYEGMMSRILKEKLGCSVYGVEINEQAAGKAKDYLVQLIIGDMEKIDFSRHFPDAMFDTLIFGDVLEHLEQPDILLQRVRPLIKDTGFILISIPNVAYAGVIFQLLQGEFNYSKKGLLDRSHIRFFTRDEIYYLLERSGFHITHLDRVISEFPQHSEFHTDLSRFSPDLVSEILKNRDNLTYQFVVRGEKTTEANLIKYLRIKNRLLQARLREARSSGLKYTEADLQSRVAAKDKDLYERDQALQEKEQRIYELGVELQERDRLIAQKDKALFERDQALQEKEQRIYELGVELQERDRLIAQKDKALFERNQAIKGKERSLCELEAKLHEQGQFLLEKGEALQTLAAKVQERDTLIQEKDRELRQHEKVLQEQERTIYALGLKIQEKNSVLAQKEQALEQKELDLSEKDRNLMEKDRFLLESLRSLEILKDKLRDRDERIEEREDDIRTLQAYIRSRKWWEFWK